MRQIPARVAALTLGLLLSGAAAAGKSEGHQNVAFDPAAFEAQRTQIERDLTRGDRYAEIGQGDRRDVLDRLASIGRMLEGVTSLDQLKANEKVELFNYQEEINTILTKAAEDSRLVCKRYTKTGSHRPETRCRTVAQLRVEREDSQNTMRDVMRAKLPEIEGTPAFNRGGGGN